MYVHHGMGSQAVGSLPYCCQVCQGLCGCPLTTPTRCSHYVSNILTYKRASDRPSFQAHNANEDLEGWAGIQFRPGQDMMAQGTWAA